MAGAKALEEGDVSLVLLDGKLADVSLVITNDANVQLTQSLRMYDIEHLNGNLDLNGQTLYLVVDEPAGFPQDFGGGTIATNDGAILWGNQMPTFPLYLENFNGSYEADPPLPPDNLYDVGTVVTLTANPDPGFVFAFWQGDVDDEADRDSNPVSLNMNQRRDVRAFVAGADPNARTWSGQGSDIDPFVEPKASFDQSVDRLASTDANWHPEVAPINGNHIYFTSTRWPDCDWDLDAELGSWTQTAEYDGTVTIETKYPGAGSFTNLVILGDSEIIGGVWTHPHNAGGEDGEQQTDRMAVRVGGDFKIAAGALIDLNGRGFAAARGPGAGIGPGDARLANARSASHGGVGALNSEESVTSYGSIIRPESLGSGAFYRGGGALFLIVDGAATINGQISADGVNLGERANRVAHGAGGSVYLRAAEVTGTGEISASVDLTSAYRQASGGGRVAVIAGAGAELDHLTLRADPRASSAGAGTIYIERPGDLPGYGTVSVAGVLTATTGHTDVPPADGYSAGEAARATFRIVNGTLRLTNGYAVGDIWLDTADATLDLGENVLMVNALEHDIGPGEVLNYGHIQWLEPGTLIQIR